MMRTSVRTSVGTTRAPRAARSVVVRSRGARPAAAHDERLVAGRYALGALLGVGGTGDVFSARDLVLDRTVAVKVVDPHGRRVRDPACRERFLAEARALAVFNHPNAVTVFDAGESNGSLFLVMEHVDGDTLADRLRRGALDPVAASSVATDVLSALDAAHQHGIIHRDVKPANVLLGLDDVAKLTDFGIAKRLGVDVGLTSSGQLFGTPKYLAPEQVDGRPVSAATDVYSVGVVLFEMLAGRPPYDGEEPIAIALAHRDAVLPDLAALAPDVPADLVAIVECALQKDPARRFASAASMRHALSGCSALSTHRARDLDDLDDPTMPLSMPQLLRAV